MEKAFHSLVQGPRFDFCASRPYFCEIKTLSVTHRYTLCGSYGKHERTMHKYILCGSNRKTMEGLPQIYDEVPLFTDEWMSDGGSHRQTTEGLCRDL